MAQVQTSTYLFLNIGVEGLLDVVGGLSNVKLILKAISHQQLLAGNFDGDVVMFDFNPIQDYTEGQSLLRYDLHFSEEEGRRLIGYLNSLPQIVTMVAYGGFGFHYPILRAALGHTGQEMPNHIRCACFLHARFEIENNFVQSNRDSGSPPWRYFYTDLRYFFTEVYERVTGRQLPYASAEGRPLGHLRAMLECVPLTQEFVEWISRPSSTTVFVEGDKLPHDVLNL